MTHKNAKVHPAMTALAAAIALSSPALAQSVDEPVVTTTPVEVAPEPVAADPPAPVADTAADPLAAEAAPVPKKAPAKTTAARSRPATARAPSPARALSSAPAAAPAAAIAAPVAEAPAAQPLPPPTEIAAEPIDQPASSNSTMNDMLPVAGIGAAALVLLAGAFLAVRRRRRRAEENEYAEEQYVETDVEAEAAAEPAMIVEPEPVYVEPERAQPTFVAASAAPVAVAHGSDEVEGPVTELPEDFDLSRFGYNVQQAYKGPTEDNPSLSLKHRLRRGSGMDAQERVLDAEVEAVTGEPVLDESVVDESDSAPLAEAPAAKPAIGHQVDGDRPLDRDAREPTLNPSETK